MISEYATFDIPSTVALTRIFNQCCMKHVASTSCGSATTIG